MKKIPLYGKYGKGKFALVDDEDFEKIILYRWIVQKSGYVQRSLHSSQIYLQRIILDDSCLDKEIDHINRDKLDNRKSNLRFCSRNENTRNVGLRKDNTSGLKGVHWDKKGRKWKVMLKAGKYIYGGRFKSKEEASKAYDSLAEKYHGKFAYLNSVRK